MRILPVGPGWLRAPVLVDANHFGRFALLTKLLSGVHGKQHGLPLTLVGTVVLTLELDEPDARLAHHQVAGARVTTWERRCQGVVMKARSRHDFSPAREVFKHKRSPV